MVKRQWRARQLRAKDVGKRATRIRTGSEQLRAIELERLAAENLRLKEEVERLRLSRAGAHPGATLAETMRAADAAADTADTAAAMYGSAMLIRAELLTLLGLFKNTAADLERRLEQLDYQAEPDFAESNTHSPGSNDSVIDLRSATDKSLSVLEPAPETGLAAAAQGA